MWKVFVFVMLSTLIWVSHEAPKNEISDEDDSIEVPIRKPSNHGFSVFRPADDAIFNFINKLVNTTYLSSRMALSRAKAQSETRRRIEDEVEDFVEHLPNIPIPILDDLHPLSSLDNHHQKQKSWNVE